MSCKPGRNEVGFKSQTILKTLQVLALCLCSFSSVGLAAQSVTLTPPSLTFSAEALTVTSAAKTVTLKNTGKSTLNISSMTASGGFATTTCPSSIAAGATCQFTVTFTPNALGAVDGAITIVDNASSATSVVSLTGTGIAPVTFSPASLTFSPTAIGTTSAPKNVTLTNNLNYTIIVSPVNTSGDYNLSSNGCTAVAAGGNCTVGITFSPTAKGTIAGVLTFIDNAPFGPAQEVALSGSGTGTVTNSISFQPASLKFGPQAINTISPAQTVTVKNTGKTALTISGVSDYANYYVSETCSGQTLNPGGAGETKGSVMRYPRPR